MPQVTGQQAGQADQTLKVAGLIPGRAGFSLASASIPSGVVIATIPAAGTSWPQSTPVRVLVSAGPPRPDPARIMASAAAAPATDGTRPPAPAADVADVAYGQALPFGAVLVSNQGAADTAAVEGLAFLALGAWLAPQTFPQVAGALGMGARCRAHPASGAADAEPGGRGGHRLADLRRLERDSA